MKPPKDNTIEVVLTFFIGIIAVALTYVASHAFPDWSQSTTYERVLALPMYVTVIVFPPTHDSDFIVVGWVGSIVIYATIGVVILCVVQSWLKKRTAKKGSSGTRI